jgi:hypothetical protein
MERAALLFSYLTPFSSVFVNVCSDLHKRVDFEIPRSKPESYDFDFS